MLLVWLQFGVPARDALPDGLGVLSSMLLPSVLILACGSLLMTTSQRLGRVVDRARAVSARFTRIINRDSSDEESERERELVFRHVQRTAYRAKLLQRAMTCLYLALGFFVATSVSIGVVALAGRSQSVAPMALGMIGVGFLFYATIVLIIESRVATRSVQEEMNFVLDLNRRHAPAHILEKSKPRRRAS